MKNLYKNLNKKKRYHSTLFEVCFVPSLKPISLSEAVFKQPEPSNISIIEIRLENGILFSNYLSSFFFQFH